MSRFSFSACLAIAFLAAVAPAAAAPGGEDETVPAWRYTVEPGDTLISIARRYLARAGEWPGIQKRNGIADPYRIPPGTVVRIPAAMLRREPGTARLEKINGSVRWRDGDGAWRAAVDGTALAAGATVETLDDSSALLTLADGARVAIGPNSTLALDALNVHAGGRMTDTRLHLPRGQADVEANPGALPQRNLRIRTPSAQAVVRGTRFRVDADAESSREETLSGRVGVSAAGRRVLVAAGKGTLIRDGKPPTRPIALLPAADVSKLPTRIETLPIRFDLPRLPGAVEWQGLIAPEGDRLSILSSKRTRSDRLVFADLPNGDYVLTLRAVDGNGLRGNDAPHGFTVHARPFPPGLNQPGDGAVVRAARPRLAWGNVVDAARYHVQVSSGADFGSPLHDVVVAGESGDVGVDLPPGTLFWRAATISATGEQGPWSPPASFTYKPAPGPVDLGKAMLRADSERLALNLPPPPAGTRYEAVLAANRDMRPALADARSDDGALDIASPGNGTFYLGVRLVDVSDGTPGPLSVQKVDIPADSGPWWLLLLLPLPLLL
ncbi:MAG: FecR domain-containing protein [Candidatus Accumulibacter sp.]|nr:FecR domain-containing protein [Accumulibacter sp.]